MRQKILAIFWTTFYSYPPTHKFAEAFRFPHKYQHTKMAPSRTRTVKNKHAANKSGISNSKSAKGGPADGIVQSRKSKGTPPSKPVNRSGISAALKARKKRVYSDQELGIPKLNMITPVGVIKPKGKKKGKVFVDDRVGAGHD
jgi:60S ribosomal subunit assembly/export protein LOC1